MAGSSYKDNEVEQGVAIKVFDGENLNSSIEALSLPFRFGCA